MDIRRDNRIPSQVETLKVLRLKGERTPIMLL